jgi:hypothetical protein
VCQVKLVSVLLCPWAWLEVSNSLLGTSATYCAQKNTLKKIFYFFFKWKNLKNHFILKFISSLRWWNYVKYIFFKGLSSILSEIFHIFHPSWLSLTDFISTGEEEGL